MNKLNEATVKINTSVMPGFMELAPADQIAFDKMKGVIQDAYELFGFIPLDTPVIERSEVLLAKAGGETEKQIYRFTKGDSDISLRFDLTIPLARYVSEHSKELVFPFRRYHIAKVYRGERAQKGRYREFYQCDIDIIGNGSLSLMNDAEIPSIIYTVFTKLNFGPFVIRINNRKLISGLLNSLGISHLSIDVMRIIDKLEKIGKEEVAKLLLECGVSESSMPAIFSFVEIKGKSDDVVKALIGLGIQNEIFKTGIEELKTVINNIRLFGVPEDCFCIDLSIARGLDYYTGTVYETTLVNHLSVGSVCSGGRYDNLAEKYTDKKLPGVGISIGLTRLFSQLKDVGLVSAETATLTKVLVVPLVTDMEVPLKLRGKLLEANIPTELYFEDGKMKNKLSYADKLGIPYVVIVGEDEIRTNVFSFKDMKTGKQDMLNIEEIIQKIK